MNRIKGVVKFFNQSKNFGFISADNNVDYFVHKSNIREEFLNDGQKVTFIVGTNPKNNKEQATEVELIEEGEEEL